MKYANLIWPGTTTQKNGTLKLNFGDILQFMAVASFLEEMGVDKNDIVYLKMEDISEYRGEPLRLLLNWSLFDVNFMKDDMFNISPDITPVFLAATINSVMFNEAYINEYNIQYLKQIEPIGCRDIKTKDVLERLGVKAYLNGCMSFLLKKREEGKREKVFFVDAPSELKEYVPQNLLQKGEILSQQIYLNAEEINNLSNIWDEIYNHYLRIRDEASLVVTSRLHVASPCVAMGIPVILAKREIDYRFDWLEKVLPMYDQDRYSDINWETQSIEYEEYKRQKKEEIWKIISGDKLDGYGLLEIPIFIQEERRQKFVDFQKCLHCNFESLVKRIRETKGNVFFSYSLWGITSGADALCEVMEREFPNATLANVYDKFRDGMWHNRTVKKPSNESVKGESLLIVLSVGAIPEAKRLIKKLKKNSDEYYFVADSFLTEEDIP